MERIGWFRLSLILLIAALLPRHSFAQAISGNLVGTLTDQSGAVVSNATVNAVNTATNVNVSGKSNESGQYRISNLPPVLTM